MNDTKYWENFYQSGRLATTPSPFAQYIAGTLSRDGSRLIDLGCGNGRDSVYFSALGLQVDGVDLCQAEVQSLNQANSNPDLNFFTHDFTELPDAAPYDHIYTRFTLHSITKESETRLLQWMKRNLKQGGKVYIEARGKRNELFGKGEAVPGEDDAFIYEGHFRRFIDCAALTEQLREDGFRIISSVEASGFAPFEDTDYVFFRIIAEKE